MSSIALRDPLNEVTKMKGDRDTVPTKSVHDVMGFVENIGMGSRDLTLIKEYGDMPRVMDEIKKGGNMIRIVLAGVKYKVQSYQEGIKRDLCFPMRQCTEELGIKSHEHVILRLEKEDRYGGPGDEISNAEYNKYHLLLLKAN